MNWINSLQAQDIQDGIGTLYDPPFDRCVAMDAATAYADFVKQGWRTDIFPTALTYLPLSPRLPDDSRVTVVKRAEIPGTTLVSALP
jgi:hypothetical protein